MSPLLSHHIYPGLVLGGRFRLDVAIASGGMGEVWRATDLRGRVDHGPGGGRRVAVKILRSDLQSDTVFFHRLRAEATNLAALDHPAIARFIEHGRDQSVDYLAMEFVPGVPLSRLAEGGCQPTEPTLPSSVATTQRSGRFTSIPRSLRRSNAVPDFDDDAVSHQPASGGILTYARACHILAITAQALAHAHARGVVHRDVKPDNILVQTHPNYDEVHVTDFGISLGSDASNLTDPGRVMGTAEYMAPERVRGAASSPLTDMYALGVTAFEVVTGYRPYDGPNPVAIAMRHVSDPLPQLPARVPRGLRNLITALLDKDPHTRPHNAGAVAKKFAELAKADSLARPSAATSAACSKEDTW